MYVKLNFERYEIFRENQNIEILLLVNISTEARKIKRKEKVTHISKNQSRYF
jgi:hypothetical protein